MLNCRKLLIAALLTLAAPVAIALETGEPDPLFQDDSAIDVTITAPMEPLPANFPEPTLILRVRLVYPKIRPR